MIFDTSIVNISVFGSYGRGSSDTNSDLDILVVCPDNGGTQSEAYVRSIVAEQFSLEPSISWYGEKKMKYFFDTGDLFAWHLFRESQPIHGFKHISEIFGKPQPYRDCQDDVLGLVEILEDVPGQLAARPQNLVYELGIVYVCLRNISMCASSVLCEQVDFGRHSPYRLPGTEFLIDRSDYDVLASCRHASTRGLRKPKIEIATQEILERCIYWANSIKRRIE